MRRALVTTVVFLVLAPAASAHPGNLAAQIDRVRDHTNAVLGSKCQPQYRIVHANPYNIPRERRHVGLHRWQFRHTLAHETPKGVCEPNTPTSYARWYIARTYGWSGYQWDSLYLLWMKESGWIPCRHYPSSTNCGYSGSSACGIPQFVPCGKLLDACGADYLGECHFKSQIRIGLRYIIGRYGSPAGAWGHSQAYGWY